jgi:hypothetical protein
MNDTQRLIALIALSEQTFEKNYYAWYRIIFRRNPFRFINTLLRDKRRIL